MELLALVHHYPPDVNSTGLLMQRLFDRLAKDGHGIEVITSFPHYEGFRVWPEYRGKLKATEEHNGIPVTRVYSFTSGRKSMWMRLSNYLTFNVSALIAGLFRRRRYGIVFCTNGSFFSGVSGFLIAKRMGARLVYNVQDLYPEVPVAQGELTRRWQIGTLARIERFMYRRADRVTVIMPPFKDNIIGKGIPAEKIVVIPNFVDTDFIRPSEKDNDFAREHGLSDHFVIAHFGNIGYVYDLGTLLEAAARLADRSRIKFLIVGDGVAKAALLERARELELANVEFLGFQPAERLPEMRAACDVHVALYRPLAATYSMPSKVYEIMASGRPVLASAEPGSDLWRFIVDEEVGICIAPGDPDALAEAIARLQGAPELRRRLGAEGRSVAERDFSLNAAVKRYEELFREFAS